MDRKQHNRENKREKIRQHIDQEREHSKNYLTKKYNFFKNKAHEKAMYEGKQPKYNNFVKSAMKNNGEFHKKDIESVRLRRSDAKKYIKERQKRPNIPGRRNRNDKE